MLDFAALQPGRGLMGTSRRASVPATVPIPPPPKPMAPADVPKPILPVSLPPKPAPPLLTQRERLAVAVMLAGADGADADEIALRAWTLWPESFGMRARPEHPDTHRVLARLSSDASTLGTQWIFRTSPRTYALTPAGIERARWAARESGVTL